MKTRRYRDLALLSLGSETLVTACDSCGAVGEKEGDVLACPPSLVGALTARVALMEVLCAGAALRFLYNNLCCEMEPTGEQVIRGIQEELIRAELDIELLSGSTEENFPTAMTALGVVAVGICTGAPRLGGVRAGDSAVLVARPLVGQAILDAKEGELFDYDEIRKLLAQEAVREIAPCGSGGAMHEAEAIAACNDLTFFPNETDPRLLTASAGTASCAVLALAPELLPVLPALLGPGRCRVIGHFA